MMVLPGTGTLPHLLQRPLVILRVDPAGTVDDYGNQRPAVIERVDMWGYLEQTEASEVTVDEQTYRADWLMVLPAGTPLDGWDRVEVPDLTETDADGNPRVATFEVIGTPERPRRPWANTETQVQATLRRVTA
jgi:hypothetical protein